jgi:hypothetical protein
MIRAVIASCLVTSALGASLRGEVEIAELAATGDGVQQIGIYQNYPISTLINYGYKECLSTLYK